MLVCRRSLAIQLFTGAAAISGQPPKFSSDAMVPRYAPNFLGLDAEGKPFRLLNWYAKVIGVQFTLPACPHCQTSAQTLQQAFTKFGGGGFQAVCVLVDSAQPEKAAEFANSQKLSIPVIVAKEPESIRSFLALKMGKQSVQMPQLLLLDRWHRVRHHFGGENPFFAGDLAQNLEGLLAPLIAERPKSVSRKK
jgi:peroxiredoxin